MEGVQLDLRIESNSTQKSRDSSQPAWIRSDRRLDQRDVGTRRSRPPVQVALQSLTRRGPFRPGRSWETAGRTRRSPPCGSTRLRFRPVSLPRGPFRSFPCALGADLGAHDMLTPDYLS